MSRQESPAYGWPAPRQSIIGTFCKCVAAVAITGILCGTGVVVSTAGIAHGQLGNILNFAGRAMDDLPGVLEKSAPALADAMHDRRDPKYVRHVDFKTELVAETRHSYPRTVIEIKNDGEEVLSVLAIRAVYVDQTGRAMSERVVYGATPLAIEKEWRGPLFPGVTRKVVVPCPPDAIKVELEVAELRVWDKDAKDKVMREEADRVRKDFDVVAVK